MTAPVPLPGMVTGIVHKHFPYVDPGTGFVIPAESAAHMTSGVVAARSLERIRVAYPGRRPAYVGAYDGHRAWVVLGVYPTPEEGEEAIASLLTSIAMERWGSRGQGGRR